MLVVRYEDMRRDTEATLSQVLDFLGLQKDRGTIQQAIANNTLDRMRVKEDTAKQSGSELKKGTLLRNHDTKRFVGSAPLGGWRERLTAEQVLRIDQHAGEVLQRLGYPLGRAVLESRKPELSLQAQG